VWAVDVVEACNAAFDAKVAVVVHAQLLAGQLLQAIRVLRLLSARKVRAWDEMVRQQAERASAADQMLGSHTAVKEMG
jgi:hypothetical protein